MLEAADVGDVVTLADGHLPVGSRCDAAVVTGSLPEGVETEVVIVLPDADGNPGPGRLHVGGVEHCILIPSASAILWLLDEHCPTIAP
jgi:hypothetical protein